MKPIKSYLLTPGPTQVPETILAGFAQPIMHHRTPQFKELFERVQSGLKYLFQTSQPVLLLASSGTGAMDATITNLFSAGDEVLVLNAGKFGERWGKISDSYGLKVHEIKVPWGCTITLESVTEALTAHKNIKAVLMQASETSTGVELPVEQICQWVQKNAPHVLTVVDAITALGVIPLPMDQWNIDVLITGSQKALMLPPGLACLAFSEKAWKANEKATLPKFYFNLKKEKETQLKGQTAWTPAVSLIQGLDTALLMMQKETLDGVFARHKHCAGATRAAVTALGLELFAKVLPSSAVTAVMVPKEIADGKLIGKTMRDRLGVSIAGGQDQYEGKIFRLTHLGYIDRFDILTGIGALELTLKELGYTKFSWGAGTGAVLEYFSRVQ